MVTPVMSLRADPKHRSLVRATARALKDNPKLAKDLNLLIQGRAVAGSSEPALGPFKDQTAALDFIRDRLVAMLGVEEIWLFGSRARGIHRPDSDIDILAVFPDDDSEALDYRRAYAPVMASGLACDLVPCRRADFESDRKQPGTLPFAAVTEGRRIYAARVKPHAKS